MANTLANQRDPSSISPTDVLKVISDPREIIGKLIYEYAMQGLEELITMDNSFSQFKESLFNCPPGGTRKHRQNKDAANNHAIKFLIMLVPYASTKSGLKAASWVLYNSYIYDRKLQTLKLDVSDIIGAFGTNASTFHSLKYHLLKILKLYFFLDAVLASNAPPLTLELIYFLKDKLGLLPEVLNRSRIVNRVRRLRSRL